MNKPTSEMTQLECAQLLRDFIRAEIELAIAADSFDSVLFAHRNIEADKLFAQIAGTGEVE